MTLGLGDTDDFATVMPALLDSMVEFCQHDRDVLKHRYVAVVVAAEAGAARAERWDAVLFVMGFVASLMTAVSSAVNYASFVNPTVSNGIGIVVLMLASLSSACQGMRQRMNFNGTATLLRQLSSKLQRIGFLFVARAAPYNGSNRQAVFQRFVSDVETTKAIMDQTQLQMRDHDDANGSLSTTIEGPAPPTPAVPPPSTVLPVGGDGADRAASGSTAIPTADALIVGSAVHAL